MFDVEMYSNLCSSTFGFREAFNKRLTSVYIYRNSSDNSKELYRNRALKAEKWLLGTNCFSSITTLKPSDIEEAREYLKNERRVI